ncbi:McrB family protein [Macromonas bipunctata]|uniref:McrB family protein n=1 Tax=Macromonas bipunctata TaxID=183670 RepID=UPI000C3422FE|nr:AAA family ATPase [Macromonas bipunctata]
MVNFQEQYALWDKFLSKWPVSRLESMTLDEYSLAGSQDSFTYWIESRLDKMGSIWGGSSFKFGVYSRRNTEHRENDNTRSYSPTHGWLTSLGETAEVAFEQVRCSIVQVAQWAAKGKIDNIESLSGLGEVFKWKIAFHYQDRTNPTIVNIFKSKWLAACVGSTVKQSMASLQKATLAKRSLELGILEFGEEVWKAVNLEEVEQPPSLTTIETHNMSTSTCFNRIYYGPPGTGKTYTLMQLLKRDYELQAMSISAEEWRSQIIAEKIAVLKWWEGVAAALYDLDGKAKVADIAEHPFVRAIANAKNRSQGIKQTLWGTLQHHTIDSSVTVNTKLRMGPAIFDKTADSFWQFAGEWPDACADLISLVDQLKAGQHGTATVQCYSFVTFHQSYGYEEFVEGLRPVLNDAADAGEVAYEIRPGAFKELCRKARQAPNQRFAMVIDEINRGNISKIFGELITLIEPDKRDPLDGSRPPVELTLAYSGEKFSVPANVDIIGTMNTADRSLALLDTALRRRFDFVPLLPDIRAEKDAADPHSAPLAGLVVTTANGAIDVRRMLERINERIEALYDRDHCIGHAYFKLLANIADGNVRFEKLADIFRNRIMPLLEEYFFEDWHKIRLMLGDNQKPEPAQFITESEAHEQNLSDLFGNNHSLDSYATKRRYQPQPPAFTNPDAYIGIYQPLS